MMLFFDIDGTLLDHKAAVVKAVLALLSEAKLKTNLTSEDILKLWHSVADHYYSLYLQNKLSFREQGRKRIQKFFACLGVKLSNVAADEKFSYFLSAYEQHWRLFDEVASVLKILRERHKLGIISNGYFKQQIRKLEQTKILDYFSNIVISSKCKLAKPDPNIFILACKQSHKTPSDCMYIGDSWSQDVEPSYQVGFKPVWIQRSVAIDINGKLPKQLPRILCIGSLICLPAIIDN